MQELRGRTVLLTGASSGIGLDVVRRMRAELINVFAVDVAPPREQLDGVRHLVGDVAVSSDVERVIQTAVRETGRLDVVCNNADTGSTSDVVTCTGEEWDRVFAVNARGVFLGIKHAIPHMLGRGGVIVNTASAAGLVGLPKRAAYCAARAP